MERWYFGIQALDVITLAFGLGALLFVCVRMVRR